ncbi:MAG: hypothetical protein ACFB9M_11430 [Myxococcota bacterium]
MRHLAFPLCLMAFWTTSVPAAVVLPLGLEAKYSMADRVVHARVRAVSAILDEGSAYVRSEITLEVIRAWKGPSAASLVVHRAGGTSGRLTTWGEGLHPYREGDEVVLFLEARHDGGWVSIGVGIGTYAIEDGIARCPAGGPDAGPEPWAVFQNKLAALLASTGEPAPVVP